ncbi:MAG: hypothetical protein JJ863_20865 [Deltaproteobacteria bacterium]|nr:hypothetical protein [Deltaproteobacteria bacterium]
MSGANDTRWHGTAPPMAPEWTLGRLGYLVALLSLTLALMALRPAGLALLAPAVLAICVTRHAFWVDALWLASVSAAAIVAAFARVNVAPYGLGGSTTHLAAIEAEMRDGPIFHMGLAIYRFSYSTFLLVLLFALPALLAPFAQWIVNVRDRWSRRNASDRPTEF